jgi:hypothetical protein
LQFAATRLRVLQNIFLAYLSHASLLLSRCCCLDDVQFSSKLH